MNISMFCKKPIETDLLISTVRNLLDAPAAN